MEMHPDNTDPIHCRTLEIKEWKVTIRAGWVEAQDAWVLTEQTQQEHNLFTRTTNYQSQTELIYWFHTYSSKKAIQFLMLAFRDLELKMKRNLDMLLEMS